MAKVIIVDFKSTLTDFIVRRMNELNVEYNLVENKEPLETFKKFDHIIFSGSPDTVFDGGKLIDKQVLELNIPILGICYGHQLIHYLSGGEVVRSKTPEEGKAELNIIKDSPLFKGLPTKQIVMMHHNDEVIKLAPGFELLANTENCGIAATQNCEKKLYTLQFHPEDDGNECGIEIIKNFIENC